LRLGALLVPLAAALAAAGSGRDVRSRPEILKAMEQVMGAAPAHRSARRGGPEVRVVEETQLAHYIRRKITYPVEGPSDRVPAWLLIPNPDRRHGQRRMPAMVCLHQTTRIGKDEPAGLGGKDNLHYAAELAERGFVAIAPDYPNFGEYQADAYAMGYLSASMKGIVNHRRTIDVLESLAEVDSGRIGAIGHSLGGHNSLFLAAFDPRIKAVVTSCGFTSFARYMHGDLTGWSHRGYMPRIASEYGKDPARMPFDFSDVLGAIAPRAVFINAPLGDSNFDVEGVRETVAAVRKRYGRRHADRLVAVHPDAAHDFPPEVRDRAYQWLERTLGGHGK
jgi:hypothetical protein